MTKDVIIVGGGLAGLTLAVSLLKKGYSVQVVTDEADHRAASPAAHGISTIKGILESDDDLFADKLEGHRGFDPWLTDVESLIGVSRPKHVWINGVSEAFVDLTHFQKEFGRIYRRDFIGAKRVWLDDASKNCLLRANYPGDWWIDPSYFISVLKQATAYLGGQWSNDRIQSVQYQDQNFQLVGGKGSYRAKILVLSTGAGTVDLATNLGVELEALYGVSGYTFKASKNTQAHEFQDPVTVKGTLGFAVSQSDLFWGSTSDKAEKVVPYCSLSQSVDHNSQSTDDSFKIWATLGLKPPPPPLEQVQRRWGVRVRIRTRRPLCGRVMLGLDRHSELWVNTGYYKSGIILTWLFAERLADAMHQR